MLALLRRVFGWFGDVGTAKDLPGLVYALWLLLSGAVTYALTAFSGLRWEWAMVAWLASIAAIMVILRGGVFLYTWSHGRGIIGSNKWIGVSVSSAKEDDSLAAALEIFAGMGRSRGSRIVVSRVTAINLSPRMVTLTATCRAVTSGGRFVEAAVGSHDDASEHADVQHLGNPIDLPTTAPCKTGQMTFVLPRLTSDQFARYEMEFIDQAHPETRSVVVPVPGKWRG